MPNYTTTSGFSDLIGSMVVTNNNVDSYTSNTQGVGTVQNLGGTSLRFNVRFAAVNRTYNINGNTNGNGYSGNANNNSPSAGEESWAATASTADTVTASAADIADVSTADAATKKAAN
ncbi:MAG: hypothetical protein M3449_01290 [Acidobacteriota bacterium]|nr:hypothetical protein [Blastocatellia bacterium]MDQ3220687.1 hypothetical protein [Acidobacteriota bacterium]MDQ3489688.1 hypothetical protein [Acidobacteriota bacterium]